ncbi:ApeP family dehydratase [Gilliamella sp. ESL0250]|uniref:ApeP family dehydratase n=1 Tax=Gilliamella sp. ESL0250 TaxID=2705036 RepID=UPI001885A0F2|nr:3-hydroxy-fatty acyl-ACP dehydratase [Gilliamella sp. ESL0250]NUF48703.1 3-hydroxy-fatty acyl-ACP dehydratase [Gilliamella sp. ESL0250]
MQYYPAIYYLPHEKPMVMVEKVHLIDDEQCICSVQVNKNGILAPFLNENNELPNLYTIELMAQTIGVWNGYHGIINNKKPQLGMLLGGRSIKTSLPTFPHYSNLIIHANLVLFDTKLANFDCQIKIDDQCVVSGKLNVYEPDQTELDYLFGQNRLGEEKK